ncbi:acyl-CoA thioesterase [Natrinema gelatinilyticum]|uniref:acyl-CoA thioesterase n=1 Tax=Natrinema gelatinilyticum TaxID=2961571 RepID=UPI0020C309B3|nr:thioesterase family protein [Natrinema gelatinilyticum]
MSDYEMELTARYGDSDAMGHINNAVYSTYMEHAATAMFGELLDVQIDEVPLAIVRLELNFERQIEICDTVTSAVTVTEVGEKSIVFDHELSVDGVTVATAKAVRVALDDDREGAIPVPDEWRERLESNRE